MYLCLAVLLYLRVGVARSAFGPRARSLAWAPPPHRPEPEQLPGALTFRPRRRILQGRARLVLPGRCRMERFIGIDVAKATPSYPSSASSRAGRSPPWSASPLSIATAVHSGPAAQLGLAGLGARGALPAGARRGALEPGAASLLRTAARGGQARQDRARRLHAEAAHRPQRMVRHQQAWSLQLA